MVGADLMLACAMCFGPNTVGDVGAGMNPGLLFLLAAPYAVAGIFGALVYMTYRRVKASRLEGIGSEGTLTIDPTDEERRGDGLV